MAITIKDIAKKAGVSISTVSRVLNDSRPVSDEIKRNVLKIINEYNYKPNPTARNLVLKKSNLIGVMVSDISSSFIGEMLNAIEDIAKTYEYDVILCNSYDNEEQEQHYFNLMQSKQVEGILILTSNIKPYHKNIIENKDIPVVVINSDASKLGAYSVTIDYKKAFEELTDYLISIGHKNICFFKSIDTITVFSDEQLEGYNLAHKKNNLKVYKKHIIECNGDMSDSYKKMDKLIKTSKSLPTAVISSNDDISIGVLNAIIDNGLEVPKDISVCATYDSKLVRIHRPQLTSIVHPTYDIGAIAIRLIIKKINGVNLNTFRYNVPYTFVSRSSTRAL